MVAPKLTCLVGVAPLAIAGFAALIVDFAGPAGAGLDVAGLVILEEADLLIGAFLVIADAMACCNLDSYSF